MVFSSLDVGRHSTAPDVNGIVSVFVILSPSEANKLQSFDICEGNQILLIGRCLGTPFSETENDRVDYEHSIHWPARLFAVRAQFVGRTKTDG